MKTEDDTTVYKYSKELEGKVVWIKKIEGAFSPKWGIKVELSSGKLVTALILGTSINRALILNKMNDDLLIKSIKWKPIKFKTITHLKQKLPILNTEFIETLHLKEYMYNIFIEDIDLQKLIN